MIWKYGKFLKLRRWYENMKSSKIQNKTNSNDMKIWKVQKFKTNPKKQILKSSKIQNKF